MCLTLSLQLVSFVDCSHFFIYSFIYLLFIFWDFHTCICVSILSTPMTSSTPPRILLSLYVFFSQCTGCNQYCLLCAWVSWGHPLDLSTRAPYSPLSHHGPCALNGDFIFLGSLETSGGGASWRKYTTGRSSGLLCSPISVSQDVKSCPHPHMLAQLYKMKQSRAKPSETMSQNKSPFLYIVGASYLVTVVMNWPICLDYFMLQQCEHGQS